MIHIIYRTCEKFNPINGYRPLWCQDKNFKFKCLKSLASGLIEEQYKFIVIGDSLSNETENKIKEIIPSAEIKKFEKLGNQKSLLQSYNAADEIQNDLDIVFFCEDDYLFTSNWMRNMNHFFSNIAKSFEYSFYHPTDYPDQYRSERMRRSYLFVNQNGGWFREVDSTTCTKACSVKTYNKFKDLIKDCAIRKKIGYDRNGNEVYDDSAQMTVDFQKYSDTKMSLVILN